METTLKRETVTRRVYEKGWLNPYQMNEDYFWLKYMPTIKKSRRRECHVCHHVKYRDGNASDETKFTVIEFTYLK